MQTRSHWLQQSLLASVDRQNWKTEESKIDPVGITDQSSVATMANTKEENSWLPSLRRFLGWLSKLSEETFSQKSLASGHLLVVVDQPQLLHFLASPYNWQRSAACRCWYCRCVAIELAADNQSTAANFNSPTNALHGSRFRNCEYSSGLIATGICCIHNTGV